MIARERDRFGTGDGDDRDSGAGMGGGDGPRGGALDEPREPDPGEHAQRRIERRQVPVVVAHLVLRQDEEERRAPASPRAAGASEREGRRRTGTSSGAKCSAGPRSQSRTSGQPGNTPGVASFT